MEMGQTEQKGVPPGPHSMGCFGHSVDPPPPTGLTMPTLTHFHLNLSAGLKS